ncbi:MAG: rhomboid family intramembrane serine protease [Candidatus Latescibacterota bacterium]|jgi:membrane associated rhomboid family serine protease|nr:MAG: rhomboid family intramembrane serine protease [Candidatus Latescibacterota bacterium]
MSEYFAPVTIGIVVLTALVSLAGFGSAAVLDRFIFDPRRILRRREYVRLVSSGFLHANLGHLFVNMFSLYSFGGPLESEYGAAPLCAIYFSAILGGNLLSLWLHRNESYLALGASGGVCGVVYAAIFLFPGGSVMVFPIPIPIPSYLYAVLFIFISFFGMRRRWGNIGHDAHLGGAIIGLAATTALYPGIVRENAILWSVVMALSLGLFAYLYRRPRAAGG